MRSLVLVYTLKDLRGPKTQDTELGRTQCLSFIMILGNILMFPTSLFKTW